METIGLYCGSFNPFHVGHMNIVEKAAKIFGWENLVIAQGINPSKPDAILRQIHNVGELRKHPEMLVRQYSFFTHDLIKSYVKNGWNVVLIKGLRNGDDLAYENNQVSFIKDFYPDLNVIYIPCDKEFEYISSSAIRQLESFQPGSGEKYLVK